MTTASLAVHVRVSAPLRQFLRVRSILSIPISALSAVLALAYVPLRLSVWVNQSAVAKRNEVLSIWTAPLFLMPAKRGKNVGSQGKSLRVTGKEPLPFYRLPIRKRSFAYTQKQTQSFRGCKMEAGWKQVGSRFLATSYTQNHIDNQ